MTTDNSVRRRRACEECGKRFTTYEKLEVVQFLVIKRSGSREPYIREKLRAGLSRACAKTNITAAQIDDLVDSVENEMLASGRREISSVNLGEMVLGLLSFLDHVAYVRFASVYRQFRSIDDFISALSLLKSQETAPITSEELSEIGREEPKNEGKKPKSVTAGGAGVLFL